MEKSLKVVFLCFSTVFIFLAASFCVNISAQAAEEISGYNRFSHNAYSFDWGWKTFNYHVSYYALAITGGNNAYKAVANQDVHAYKIPADGIWPPSVGNGMVNLYYVYLLDTNNTVKASQSGQIWSNGLHWPRMLPPGTLSLLEKHCYDLLKGIPAGTTRICSKELSRA
ncbi:hypothetical protein Tph_c17580 [Thermacetogenium phaeum DSM 12270]|uniref:Uncharacterized protein n=2 Tax=Thermacetogenium phaeum TaxID=85874 RepID=K4LG15_THEPS|nr:hypothetical protein Tph_c17580 [Thermacetogenium phaeum DSM 12270]